MGGWVSVSPLTSQERELSDYESQVDVSSLENSLRSLRGEKRSVDEKVIALQGELSRIVQHSSARGALEASKKQRRSKEEDYQNQSVIKACMNIHV